MPHHVKPISNNDVFKLKSKDITAHDLPGIQLSQKNEPVPFGTSAPLTTKKTVKPKQTIDGVIPLTRSPPLAVSSVAPNDEEDIRKLVTAEDAVAFFSKCDKHTPVKFVYLNRAHTGLRFRPYDLRVVMRGEQLSEHFTISSTGVLHVEPAQPSEVVSLSDWMRESTLFNILTRIKLFKHYLIGKAFLQWRKNIRFKLFCGTRKRLAKKFYLSKGTFSKNLMELHHLAYDLSVVPLLLVPAMKKEFLLDGFRDAQAQQRSQAALAYQAIMDKMETKLGKLCDNVVQRANVPDLTTQESLEQYLLANASMNSGKDRSKGGKKMKSMVEAQQEQRERMRALKRAMVENDLLGGFIKLIDYMAAESLFKGCVSAVKLFLDVLQLPADKKVIIFQITISFAGEERLSFIPSENDIMEMFNNLYSEMVHQVSQCTRLIYLKAFKVHFPLQQPKTFHVAHSIKNDHRYLQYRYDTQVVFAGDFATAWETSKTYSSFRQWYVFALEEWPVEYARWESTDFKDLSHNTFTTYIRKVRSSEKDLEKMHNKSIGVLYLNSQKLRNELQPAMQQILATIRNKLIEVSRRKTLKLMSDFNQKIKILSDRPTNLKTFAAFVQSINEIRQDAPKLNDDADEIELLYQIALDNGIDIPHEDTVKKDMVVGGSQQPNSLRQSFEDAIQGALEYKTNNLKNMSSQLDYNIEHINEELLATMAILNNGDYVNQNSDTRDVLAQLAGVKESIESIREKVETYTEFQKLFEMVTFEWTNLQSIQKLYQQRFDIWSTLDKWQEKRHVWGSTPLDTLDVDQMKDEVNEFYKKGYQLHRENKDDVTEFLLEMVKDEKSVMPIILDLGNKAMKKEHWAKIFAGMQKPFAPDTTYTLDGLRAWKIFDYRSLIEEQSGIATGESHLQQTLDKVKAAWDDMNFELKLHRDQKDNYILGGVDDILQLLEDHQVTMQTCLASRFVSGVRPRVEDWDRRLGILQEVIDEWVTCQKNWMYLEYIFSSEDIKRQLPDESRKFTIVDKEFRDLMKKAHINKNVLQVCCEPQVLDSLRESNRMLDDIQKKLEDYLETKRVAFPRFYFLSNDELLQILSDVRNPSAVQPHLSKCFDNIKQLEFRPDSATEIAAMVSSEGEVVPFSSIVIAKGNVENWLSQIESMMRITILDHLKVCQKAYWETERNKWYMMFPAQCISCVDMIVWTSQVETALTQVKENASSVQQYLDTYIQQLEDTVELVKGQLTKLQRTCIGTLIVLDVHARDVVAKLIKAKCTSINDFDWSMQLRYYWESDNVTAHMTNAHFIYGYEYLGNAPRLVITPLTDRCFMTCTGALHLNLGGAPQGPAGTGKTESVKDLAKALARQCVVFNCSDGLDYHMMARMFSGLAQAGAWACFDEFNRIDVEVLSVIAQQMLEITTAIAQKMNHMHFEGREISLSPNFGVFITMNPGYAGRTELPDNLKALFRPVCMMIPDYALIAEIMFYSEGFKNAKNLAGKMVQLYKLSSEQLSKQDHYDFGMRAVKSILVMAGSLKRANPNSSEDMLLIRAMRDSNVPKFLADDTVLFMALIRDLFPAVVIEDAKHPDLSAAIETTLSQNNHQSVPEFILKVIQLQETMVVRHGVMLVGQTFCGKSVCRSTLSHSLHLLHEKGGAENAFYQPTHQLVMNPKAITMGELYGEINEVTREWTDGILSFFCRKAVAELKKDRTWLVFDGPVDALWVENLNTVLDDNKMLCLVNGERIKLPETVSFMFEVQDLRVASPATVSRCGMVFMEPYNLKGGWRPIAASFNAKQQAAFPPPANGTSLWRTARCNELLDSLLAPALTFLRANCTEYVPTVDGQLVLSLLNLLKGFLTNLAADDDRPDEDEEATPPAEKAADGEEDEHEGDKEGEAEKKAQNKVVVEDDEDKPDLQFSQREMDNVLIFDMYFVLSLVWSLGGNLVPASRHQFSEFVKENVGISRITFPTEGSVYDYFVHKKSLSFVHWVHKVPQFVYYKDAPYFSISVPTVDTVVFKTIVKALISVDRGILVNGPTGVGKSQLIQSILYTSLKADQFMSFDVTFSAQTSSKNLQERMESKLVKKKGHGIGAPAGKKVVFFIDDLNMPQLEEYGASPPIELLRQVIDQGGFYDRKKIQFKDISDLICLAACGPPGGGRNELTPRLTSKFHTLCFGTLSEASMQRIFRSIMKGFLSSFNADVQQLARPLVSAAVEIFNIIQLQMKPTPSKSHYTFNLRDLSKVVQGILMSSPVSCQTPEQMTKLWIHECSRVFHDRLADDKDRDWWWETLAKTVATHFEMPWRNDYRKAVFGDFMDKDSDKESRLYMEIRDPNELQATLVDYLMGYNVNFNKETELVFFEDAVFHLARICRILRQPRGNALLVGVGGSGRQSLTHLAAFMADMRLYQIMVTRNFGVAEFREDLKKVLLDAGCDDKPVVFLLTDVQIVKEQFLEDINSVLNTGEVPNLLQTEDLERIMSSLRDRVRRAGKPETREVMLQTFIHLCRENLHMVVAMSPVGDQFRSRLRMFPSLVNCMTIDWFNKWPKGALLSVAHRFFDKTEFDTEREKNAVCEMCVHIHQSVGVVSEQFYAELRRRNYTTPTSYLELLHSYTQILEERQKHTVEEIRRFQGGLDKLIQTGHMVDDMEKDLRNLQPILEQAAKETESLMEQVDRDQKIAAEARVVCVAEERECQSIMDEAALIRDSCQADLDKAMPAYHAACKALDSLNKKDIDEIKSFGQPPDKVKMVLEAILLLFKEKSGWDNAKKILSDLAFLSKLQNFDKDNIPEQILKKLQPIINHPDFTPENIKKVSFAAMSLCMWVRAIDTYAKVVKNVEPKKAKLKGAEEKLDIAKSKLRLKQEELAAQEAKVAKLQKQHQDSIEKKKNLETEMRTTEVRLERAGKLVHGLASERQRWDEQVKKLEGGKVSLVGNMLLAAGVIAYHGPFTADYRAKMLREWSDKCKDVGLPADEGFKVDSLVEAVKVRAWGLKGLPLDAISIENAVIQSRARRWCLMIDPQGQANQWVKNMERDKGLKVLKQNDGNMLRTLENSIRVGIPVLLENVGESLDPALDPVLQRQTFRQGGRLLLRLGDADVDYDPNFRFYVTTKLPNPHYLPELQIKVTIINFTVTRLGLEDQLLVDVVRYEREELEKQKDKLVVQIAEGNAQLKATEDKILALLGSSSGNILDNEMLINTLAQSKRTSEEITKDVQTAEETSKDISETRERYRPVATRGSLIYGVIAEISSVDHMYQNSLQFFKKLFGQTLERTEKTPHLQQRIDILINAITENSYMTICRGLFEKDKALFAFLMAASVLRHSKIIQEEEFAFFLRGAASVAKELPPSTCPSWLEPKIWTEVRALNSLKTPLHGIEDHMLKFGSRWQAWIDSDDPHEVALPFRLEKDEEIGIWHRLLVLKVLKEEKLIFGLQQVVGEFLGSKFTESPQFNLEAAFEDSAPTFPIIFVLSPGSDPTAIFLNFAAEKGFGERKKMLSLGQGQGPKAEDMIAAAIKSGDWVYLQNCHLSTSWMPALEKLMEDLILKDLHPDFRLWLTSMPTPEFPVPVLQSGVKLTKEPPKGLRANLRDTFASSIGDKVWNAFAGRPELSVKYRKMIFSLAYFHAVVQERRKFGPLGWNIPYEWNLSDFSAAMRYVQIYLEDFDEIPWPALRYMVGVIHYGGRVTDFLDQRCLSTILSEMFDVKTLSDEHCFTADMIYHAPRSTNSDLGSVAKYINTLPPYEKPEVFGLGSNADITFQQKESRATVDTIISIQPRTSNAHGISPDDAVIKTAQEFLAQLPLLLSKSKQNVHTSIYTQGPDGLLESLTTFLLQEVDRFNKLITVVEKTLKDLIKAVKGEVVMSKELDSMHRSFLYQKVPQMWNAYPSNKPLAAWYADLRTRVDFVRKWLQNGKPYSFWISGFFFPQGFLTGVLQTHARKYHIPIDELKFQTHVLKEQGEHIQSHCKNGVHIHGLFLEGACWDGKTLVESKKGELLFPMPCIGVECVQSLDVNPEKNYTCPLYKTSTRAGSLSTTGLSTNFVLNLDLPTDIVPKHWIHRGVALLCMRDD